MKALVSREFFDILIEYLSVMIKILSGLALFGSQSSESDGHFQWICLTHRWEGVPFGNRWVAGTSVSHSTL